MKQLFLLLIPALLMTACVIDESDSPADPDADGSILFVGDRLPVFSVEVTDPAADTPATTFSSASLTGSTVVVFFNTSCRDCQRELPGINDYYLAHRSEPGFQLVAVAREESAESIAAYWQAHGLSLPYSPQPDRSVFNLFATLTIPRVYICSQDGTIRWMGVEDFDMP